MLTVTDMTKDGYTFNSPNSMLSQSVYLQSGGDKGLESSRSISCFDGSNLIPSPSHRRHGEQLFTTIPEKLPGS